MPVYAGHLPGPAVSLPVGKGEIAAFPKLLPCSYAVTWVNKRKFILLDLVLYTNPQTVSCKVCDCEPQDMLFSMDRHRTDFLVQKNHIQIIQIIQTTPTDSRVLAKEIIVGTYQIGTGQ